MCRAGANARRTSPFCLSHRTTKQYIRLAFKIIHLGIIAMMVMTALFGFGNIGKVKPGSVLSELFVCFYLMIFAMLFLMNEISVMFPTCHSLDRVLRRNVGFFYGVRGKAAFLVFCAFLCFGVMDSAGGIALGTGIVMCVDGLILLLAWLKYPDLISS